LIKSLVPSIQCPPHEGHLQKKTYHLAIPTVLSLDCLGVKAFKQNDGLIWIFVLDKSGLSAGLIWIFNLSAGLIWIFNLSTGLIWIFNLSAGASSGFLI
jgi:hypothetical protein